MHIDLNNLEETKIVGFKGGHGEMLMRAFVDEKCRIMRNVLKPGAASGLHKHYFENNGTEDFVFFAIVPEHH